LKVDKPFPSPKNAALAAKNFGVSLQNHKSKAVDLQLLQSNDVIFAMEARHVNELKQNYPMISKKIILLPLFDPKHGKLGGGYLRHNIPDPFSKSLDDFTTCYLHIQRCISSFIISNKKGLEQNSRF
jgi:protein-tyrosine-phosphatase